jgi:hypothetical protein
VFCTGYFYTFPFFKDGEGVKVQAPDGSRARYLWEHLVYSERPTLAFLGIPQRVVPFPLSEAQAAVVARAWAGRLTLPSRSAMQQWETDLVRAKGDGKAAHNLATPLDVEYINRLHDLAMTAEPREGLEDGGRGKEPPYWDEEKAWTRERFPMIKLAARALGERRYEVRTLEELGFSFERWKREGEGAAKAA